MKEFDKNEIQIKDCENLSGTNTLVRTGISVFCFAFALEGMLPQWLNIALGGIGLVLFTTAVTGTCIFKKLTDANR